ncbi:hypothetical protein FHW96_000668 [Novosphingobium sp. SG751A]|uniref:hypothetical protein n=1 Tax=Novosphingobium sp. SG751A TaxID=2587000 RepID=UPI001553DB10|nr:hypothetical protein [Novosphingobium sp. SG751A]NOW44526.1 hypothetical protein [Novosphingobium sp. SG751A]
MRRLACAATFGLVAMLACGLAPVCVHAGILHRALHGARLSTDIISETAMTALAHDGTETPLNRRMDVAVITLERPVLPPTMQGRALLGLDFQHAGVKLIDANDGANNWAGNPQDHFSMALTREIFVGAHLAYPLALAALPMGTRLFAGAGALRTELYDRAVIGPALRNRDRVMEGWRLSAGADAPMGPGHLRLEYRLARSSDTAPGEAAALAGSARDRLMLSYSANF